MSDDTAFLLIFCGTAAGVVGAYALVIALVLLWEGVVWLGYRIGAWLDARAYARQRAAQAVADAAHRSWFVNEMRSDPNFAGGDHKAWEIKDGE